MKIRLISILIIIALLISTLLNYSYRRIKNLLVFVNSRQNIIGEYSYLVVGPGEHFLVKEDGERETYIELGYHLNRLYFDDRYIIGEITEKPINSGGPNRKYSYFILDTKEDKYISGLNKSEFSTKLGQFGLPENIKLRSRDNLNWLEQQKRQ